MVSIIQTTDIIGSGNAVVNGFGDPALTTGDLFYLTEGTKAISTGSRVFDLNVGASFTYDWIIDGLAYGNTRAFDVYGYTPNADMNFNVTVGATGTVSSQTSYTVYIGSDGNDSTGLINFDNAGTVLGENAAALFLFGLPTITVSNTGTIRTNATDNSWSNGIFVTNIQDGSVFNSGLIETKATTASSVGSVVNDYAAVSIYSNIAVAEYTIHNTGTIRGGSHSIYMSTATSHLINSGLLDGSVYFDNFTGIGEVFNSGRIFGDVQTDNAVDTVINTGLISGNVNMSGGNDLFDGRGGRVLGTVAGGIGDDTYIVDRTDINLLENVAGGIDIVQSAVGFKLGDNFENLTLLGDGNIRGIGNVDANTLTGNIGDNRLRGHDGDDTINGGDGDDKVWGGAGLDTIRGDAGEDILRGGRNNDMIYGDDADDVLYGNANNDRLFGGKGDDRLLGGSGRDLLNGGLGQDVFVFNRMNDSLNSVKADRIADFVVGEDMIELSGLGGSKSYIGSAGFSGSAGEVQVTLSGGTSTNIKIDLDGDGTADMKILLLNTTGLTEADFLF
jgi:Ca2+-binding RTX toxin-like protein